MKAGYRQYLIKQRDSYKEELFNLQGHRPHKAMFLKDQIQCINNQLVNS